MTGKKFLMRVPDDLTHGVSVTTTTDADRWVTGRDDGRNCSTFAGDCSIRYHENDFVEIRMESDIMVVPVYYKKWFSVDSDVIVSGDCLRKSKNRQKLFSVEENEHLFLERDKIGKSEQPKLVDLKLFGSPLSLSPNQQEPEGVKDLFRMWFKRETVDAVTFPYTTAIVRVPWTRSIIIDKRNLKMSNVVFEEIFGLDVLH